MQNASFTIICPTLYLQNLPLKQFIKISALLLAAVLAYYNAKGQNLVLNPSFEENTYDCTSNKGPLRDECKNWNFSTYFIYCEGRNDFVYVPNTFLGYQFPRNGKAFATLFLWWSDYKNWRFPVTGNLSHTLSKDSLYKVKFYLNLAERQYNSKGDKVAIATTRVGAFLYSDSLYYGAKDSMVQIRNNPERFLTDTLDWMEVSGIMKAKGGERFIRIDNFWNDDETPLKLMYGEIINNQAPSVYFIDDVSVIQIKNPYLGKDTVLCYGSPITLKPCNDKADSVIWQDGSRADSFVVTQPGKYWVETWYEKYKLTDTIYIHPKYTINLGADQQLCTAQSQTYTFQLPNDDGAQYLWPDGSTNHTFTVNQSGQYWVKATKNGCTAYDTAIITFQPPLMQYALPADTILCQSRSHIINIQHIDADVTWQDGSTEKLYTINREGAYILNLKNACGALNRTFYIKEQYCPCPVFVPNAFTPNSDGVNDIFLTVSDCGFISYNLSVYNRWGVQLFSTDDAQQGWDGAYKGKTCTTDVYFYTLNAVADNGDIINVRKKFLLVR